MFVKCLILVIHLYAPPLSFFINKFLGKPRDLQWRKVQIQRMYDMVSENEERLMQALKMDMNKPANEAMSGDIAPVLDECLYFLKVKYAHTHTQQILTPLSVFSFFRI